MLSIWKSHFCLQTGEWQYIVFHPTGKKSEIIELVVSSAHGTSTDRLTMRPSVEPVENGQCLLLNLDVTQGTHGVIGLHVEAHIEGPDLATAVAYLKDNGAGIRIIAC